MQEVGGGVVALGRVAGPTVNVGADALSGLDRPALGHERDHLVISDPHYVVHAREAVAVEALEIAGVGDLATAGRVEGGLDQLDEHVPRGPAARSASCLASNAPARVTR